MASANNHYVATVKPENHAINLPPGCYVNKSRLHNRYAVLANDENLRAIDIAIASVNVSGLGLLCDS